MIASPAGLSNRASALFSAMVSPAAAIRPFWRAPLVNGLAMAGLLAGCAPVPDLGQKPALRQATASDLALPAAEPAQAVTPADWPAADWWQALRDPQLSALIAEGVANSPTLAQADARLRAARGLAQESGAALLPGISASANAAEAKQSYNNGIPPAFVPQGWNDTGAASLSLSYELDFFGKNRAALRAATSEAQAAEYEVQAARLAIATGVADAYATLARAAAARDVRAQALQLREDTAKLVRQRVVNGLDTRAEQRQAEAGIPVARADLVAADEAIALARHALAVLIGAPPARGDAIALPQLATLAPQGLPTNLALDLVGRRADVAAARARAEAAAARVQVAHAAFYPNVNLMGFIGVQALGLSNLTASGSDAGSIGPAISLPLFSGGRIAGGYRQARASYDEAVASYDDTLLKALRDVADAAASRQSIDAQRAQLQQAVAASDDAYRIARRRYEAGLSTYLSVLSAQDALLANRRLLADLQARTLSAHVALVRALGGGFRAG
ncbi:efflux transporter outer membrane subunit [Novosphingobium sp. BK486]|uniref:efflux transporter outer membrane subunit n=1 Tax=unclassified Novosphingobium TaxID=2644732 RepID=UPI0017CF911B|nr:NodT family efflux transporter outer membrane factor (OMF) lipoprotein [Novosphingobium sp. BK256]MBB3375809.1 NodT family efflux transporter outer membrane factor (OMF) lipoprotein [Novosphingobium sp. BK280]MBB3380222.1 NodT family efflux transporter outer membrane factor (OMF) lipoprotein [Novosphingobium sp. BK258]MBB3421916.1 NodT family efflux transporter outer membrane factor (OMF) lipoprotein [Novosphingobium sp. BK267]MBB3450572.1 NodT family efflux transporter outer membrane factor